MISLKASIHAVTQCAWSLALCGAACGGRVLESDATDPGANPSIDERGTSHGSQDGAGGGSSLPAADAGTTTDARPGQPGDAVTPGDSALDAEAGATPKDQPFTACTYSATATCAECLAMAQERACEEQWHALGEECEASRRCVENYCFCSNPSQIDCGRSLCKCTAGCVRPNNVDGCMDRWQDLFDCYTSACRGSC
jgi:hypothetical protein